MLTAIVWSAVGLPDVAVMRTITVLVIACPHALGLAIPLVVSIATERAARAGVLVKDRHALEAMRTTAAAIDIDNGADVVDVDGDGDADIVTDDAVEIPDYDDMDLDL